MSDYVVITPAHNEAAFLEKTIEGLVRQTERPRCWVIVNDGSSDETEQIVARYRSQHNFIRLLNVERSDGRHFGNKARAFNRGLAAVGGLDYEYIANLDADISLEPEYFETILREFERDSDLGIAGGMVASWTGNRFVSQEVALDSVAGAVQCFRRACFEDVGGYLPLPHGGIDAAAEIIARKNGWRVCTFPQVHVREHRRTGSAATHPLASRLKEGRRLYSLGYGFVFYCVRCFRRSTERPRIIGSAVALFGYLSSLLKGDPLVLPAEVVRYLRREQRCKLARLFSPITWLR